MNTFLGALHSLSTPQNESSQSRKSQAVEERRDFEDNPDEPELEHKRKTVPETFIAQPKRKSTRKVKMSTPQNEESQQTRRPLDTNVRQQRMNAWIPILHPIYVSLTLIAIGAIFIPLGIYFQSIVDTVVEYKVTYDSYYDERKDINCELGTQCTIEIDVEEDMNGPILVYYELENFYQNHREYETSRDDAQLLGATTQTLLAELQCNPLNKLKKKGDNETEYALNPCGLIANTFFNDVITFVPTAAQATAEFEMIEEGIAWQSDLEYKFRQPDGFDFEVCDCNTCVCDGDWSCDEPYEETDKGGNKVCYKYTYPNDDTTQYLHETYKGIISPLKGVTDEHFVVWMRIAAMPIFRKLYGYFEENMDGPTVTAGSKLTFTVDSNWIVTGFKGTKTLVVTTTSALGGKSNALQYSFWAVGGFCAAAGLFFGLKHLIKPRKLAHEKYLKYKPE